MSKKENTAQTVENEKKIVTKYDKKLERRAQEKAKEKKEKAVTYTVTIVVLVLLAALLLSAPIRTYFTLHETYVEIGGEAVTQVEYEYNYNIAKNNYMNTYGNYLSYFGLDTSQDITNQMYSDVLTWGDYFDQLTVDNIKKTKALKKDAKEKGFEYDVTADYEQYLKDLEAAAQDNGVSIDNYVKSAFGSLATKSRIADFVKDGLFVAAYNDKIMADNEPTKDEVESYYAENKETYDSVDYKQVIIKADLPKEPTELAETTEVAEGETYQPSEAEIEKAMADAKVFADEALETISTDGELIEKQRRTDLDVTIKNWMMDETRKAGDTAVLEDTDYHQWYVVEFEKRYRNEEPTANVRVIALQVNETTDPQAIYEEWKTNGATEEAFIAISKKYNAAAYEDDGLFKNVSKTSLGEEFTSWIFADGRKAGDAGIVEYAEDTAYLLYYVSEAEAEWYAEAKSTILSQKVSDIVEALIENVEFVNTKDHLAFVEKEKVAQELSDAAAEAVPAE